MRILLGSMALVSVLAASVPVRSAETTAAELAQSLQRKYDTIRDFSADFVHNYRSGALKKQVTERGRLLIKKPGKMRWEYTAPESKLFVSDGVKIYSYIPQDKQVVVSSVPPDDAASGPALFLAGKGNLLRDFTASFADVPSGMPPGTKALKLMPRKPQPDYDWIVLLVDQTTLGLRGLMSTDAQGGTSTFSFANLKENVNLADKEFAFQMPRGVDVVTDAGQK
jgi:outer membrane lipoprotein carrier protein